MGSERASPGGAGPSLARAEEPAPPSPPPDRGRESRGGRGGGTSCRFPPGLQQTRGPWAQCGRRPAPSRPLQQLGPAPPSSGLCLPASTPCGRRSSCPAQVCCLPACTQPPAAPRPAATSVSLAGFKGKSGFEAGGTVLAPGLAVPSTL